jgi:hypothetical protein
MLRNQVRRTGSTARGQGRRSACGFCCSGSEGSSGPTWWTGCSATPATRSRVFDLTDEKLDEALLAPKFKFVRADIRNERATTLAMIDRADGVVDLIAHANPSLYVAKPHRPVQALADPVRVDDSLEELLGAGMDPAVLAHGAEDEVGPVLAEHRVPRIFRILEHAGRHRGQRLAAHLTGGYRRRALEAIPFESFTTRGFVFDQEMLVATRILGLRVVDLPIPTRYAGEVSHLKPIPYGIAVLKLMGRYLRGDYHRLVAGQTAP